MNAPEVIAIATTTVDIAKVIQAAEANPLGVLSLVCIIVGGLAAVYFRKAPVPVRVIIFLVLFGGVAALARVVLISGTAPDSTAYSLEIARANTALNRDQVAVAEDLFKKAQDENPKGWEAVFGLGTIAYDRKQYKEALEQFEKSLELHPNDPSILNNIAMSEEALGDYVPAEARLSEAIQTTPESSSFRTDLLYDRGRMNLLLWERSGDKTPTANYQRALDDFDQFVKRKGSPVHFATYHLACLAALGGEHQNNVTDKRKSLQLLEASISQLSASTNGNSGLQRSIMRRLLTTDQIEPEQPGYPVGCPALIRTWKAMHGSVESLASRIPN